MQSCGMVIDHPKGTNYNQEIASKEMSKVWQSLDDDIKTAFSLIKGTKAQRENLSNYFK